MPLSGTTFGVDFNPAADRLRIVSDAGQNLRHNVNPNGVTLADGTLNYTAGTPASGIVAAAYTNNDLQPCDPATTGNHPVCAGRHPGPGRAAVASQRGSLMATGKLTVDGARPRTGFDIYSVLRDGIPVANRALADGPGCRWLGGALAQRGRPDGQGPAAGQAGRGSERDRHRRAPEPSTDPARRQGHAIMGRDRERSRLFPRTP